MRRKRFVAKILAAVLLVSSISDYSVLFPSADLTDQGITTLAGQERQGDGLVLYTSFDEETVQDGIVLDASGKEHNGTIHGNVSFLPGVSGNGVLITNETNAGSDSQAGDSYINFGQPEGLQFGTENFSMAFWMKSIDGGQNNSAIISNKNYANGANIGFALGNFNASKVDNRMNFSAKQGERREINNIPANDDQWHHFAVTIDRSSEMTVYLDGKKFSQINITSHTGTVDTGLDLVLGAGGNKRNALKNVYVDELYIYNQVISPEQIASLYYEVNAGQELDQMLTRLDYLLPGSAYPAEKIEAAKEMVKKAKTDMEGLGNEGKAALLEQTKQQYSSFLTSIEAQPKSSFVALSDVHIKALSDSRSADFIAGLQDISQQMPDLDALIIAGDNTGSGTTDQVNAFYQLMAEHRPVDPSKTCILLGNHDVRDGSGSWTNDPTQPTPYYDTVAKDLYLNKNAEYMPETNGKVYYDKWLNGYHFIVLNTEKGLKDSVYLSPTQLSWLEEKLAENASPDQPIFVINHQALNDTHWRSNILNGFGTEDAQVKELLSRYPQVVFLSGHTHNGLGVAEAVDRQFGTMIEIPSYSESENGVVEAGTGYYVMLFEDEILFRARNFKTAAWLPEYDIQLKLNSLPTVYKQALGVEQNEQINTLMTQARAILDDQYDQSVISAWNDVRPPKQALFGADRRSEINMLASALAAQIDGSEPIESEFEVLRTRWRNFLLGGSIDAGNPAVSKYIASLDETTMEYWSTMHKSAETDRSLLWDDLDMSFVSGTGALAKEHSGHVATTYYRLRDLAIAFSTPGTQLYQSEEVKTEIIRALDYMYEKHYNESDTSTPFFGNWWHWEIGGPIASLNTAVIMYDYLTPQQISNYTKAVNRYSPVADKPSGYPGSPAMTGANLIDKGTAVALSGILSENPAKLNHIKAAFKTVFTYVKTGDGFYEDGSFIQHQALAYMGGYGSQLYEKLGIFFVVFKDSDWELTYDDGAEQLVFDMVFNGIEPFFYDGLFMDMVSSRGITRKGTDDKVRGTGILSAIIPLSEGISSPEMKARFDSMIKYLVGQDPEYFYSNSNSITAVMKAYEILNDPTIEPRSGYTLNKLFAQMDKLVYAAPGYTLGLSMHSNRTYGHELINDEGKRTWNTSDGMTYLYTADQEQYQNGYWAAVDPTRLAGTTVEHKVFSNGAGDRQKNVYSWVGGSSIGDYGTAGMHYKAHGTGASPRNGADVKKSWFLFGDEIVAIGSGITSTTGNTVETIIDNRKIKPDLSNQFTTDGNTMDIITANGTATQLENPTWIHLEGNVEGADIGYFFPQSGTVQALYESRTGDWSSQGTSSGSEQHSFATFWFDHGANPENADYAYVILPNKSSSETAEYAAGNDLVILKNTPEVHAASKSSLGITAVNFWSAKAGSVAGISADQPASVTVQKKDGTLIIAVSDPTQESTKPIEVTVAVPCTSVVSKDNNITVLESNAFVKLLVDTTDLAGKSSTIELLMDEEAELSVVEISHPESIRVPMRTYFADLPLPEKVMVMANDLNEYEVEVEWKSGGYDRTTYGLYQIKGKLVLPEGLKDPFGLEAVIEVLVGEIESGVLRNGYVRGGTYGGANYAGEGSLIIKNDADSVSYYRKSLLEFNLDTVPDNAERIYMKFELVGTPAASFTKMNLYQTESGWKENTLNYQNFPARISEIPIGELTLEDIKSNGLVHQVEITAAVKEAKKQGQKTISIELSNPVPAANDYIALHSSHSTKANVQKPILTWEKTAVPGTDGPTGLESSIEKAKSIDPAEFADFDTAQLNDLVTAAEAALNNPGSTEEELFSYELQITKILLKLRKKPISRNE